MHQEFVLYKYLIKGPLTFNLEWIYIMLPAWHLAVCSLCTAQVSPAILFSRWHDTWAARSVTGVAVV